MSGYFWDTTLAAMPRHITSRRALHFSGFRYWTASVLPAIVGTTLPFWLRPPGFSFRWLGAIEFLVATVLMHSGFSFLQARFEHGATREWSESRLLGASASEEEFLALSESGELGEFATLHIATHAIMDSDHPDDSALVMSQTGLPDALEAAATGGRVYDGLISAKEIAREWNLDADLVTLSACETGLGKEVVGEGYVGFAQSILQSGARSLIVSLWKVDDLATALFMQRFYEDRFGKYEDERGGRTAEAMSKAEALQEAKSWLCGYTDESGQTPYEHPYYWSAFVLIGDRS